MRRTIERGVLLALLITLSSCQPKPAPRFQELPAVPEGMISVQDLANHLGMTVDTDSAALVTLRGGANHVTVIPDPAGQAYVNGLRVGPQSGYLRISGVLFVPESLEADIRSALQPPKTSPNARGPRTRREHAGTPLSRAFRIVVDPGHGGKDPGTRSRAGLEEKTITLPVARELARLLKQDGFDVTLTRQSDVFVELDDRGALANRLGADLFVSIHADACPDPAMRGFCVYTNRDPSTGSRGVARAVAESLQGASIEGLGMRQANYRVLVVPQCPAILVELGYLSNGLDAEMLADRSNQEDLARAIADGIGDYFRR